MPNRKQLLADFLFGVQILGAVVFGGSRITKLLHTVQGALLSEFILIELFLSLNIFLALSTHNTQATRLTRQGITTYAVWFVIIASSIAATLVNGSYVWSNNDTLNFALVLAGNAVVLGWAKHHGRGIQDPMIKAWVALVSKALPQLVLGWNIYQHGGGSLPPIAVAIGNGTILLRLVQIYLTARENGWTPGLRGLILAESGNEISWLIVSVIWFVSPH